jgi:hypothetical protein
MQEGISTNRHAGQRSVRPDRSEEASSVVLNLLPLVVASLWAEVALR